MTTKHTPGPWRVDNHCDVAAQDRHVATPSLYGDGSDEANARLIAAAPDLLQGLEDMIGHCQGCNGRGRCYGPVPGSPGSYASNQPCQDCSDARAAIKKARGEP